MPGGLRVLLTGASGFLGRPLLPRLGARHAVTGTFRGSSTLPVGAPMRRLDLSEAGACERIVDETRPELVIHLAAVSSPDDCEREPEAARRVNVEAAAALARASASAGARFIFLSTDQVFAGDRPPYREADPPAPLSEYGRGKRDAELAVLDANRGFLVLRLSLCYGWNPGGGPSFTDTLYESLSQGRRARAFADQRRTMILIDDAAEAVARLAGLAERGSLPGGILNLAGPESVSRLRFAQLFCSAFGFDPDLIEPVAMAEAPQGAPRPGDCSLDGSRLWEIAGFRPDPVEKGLKKLREQFPISGHRLRL